MRLRPIALWLAVLLLVPVTGYVSGASAAVLPQASPTPTEDPGEEEEPEEPVEPPRRLSPDAIAGRARPALYSIDTSPADRSAFAFARDGDRTLLATTYQNVLAAARLGGGINPQSFRTLLAGTEIRGAHQIVRVARAGVSYGAQVIAADLERDVAILRIPRRVPILPPECRERAPAIGERTYAFAAGGGGTRAARIVAFLAPDQIQTGHDLAAAAEGGPLVNGVGRAVGVTARQAESSDIRGFHDAHALSVDIDAAMDLAGLPNVCPREEIEEPDPAPEGELTPAQLAEVALPAVASVESVRANSAIFGSGFAVHSDGESTWIATNFHVLGDATLLTRPAVIIRRGQLTYRGEIASFNRRLDLALVRVAAPLPVLQVSCERVRRGTRVAAIGSPGDFESFATQRDVFQEVLDRVFDDLIPVFTARSLGTPVGFAPWLRQGPTIAGFCCIAVDPHPSGLPHWQTPPYLEDTLAFGRVLSSGFRDVRHNTKIFRGNSGGPLLDMQGRVVGINYRVTGETRRFAINAQRLFERLAEGAGIPDPCEVQEEGPTGGPSGEPAEEPTATPSFSPPPGVSPPVGESPAAGS